MKYKVQHRLQNSEWRTISDEKEFDDLDQAMFYFKQYRKMSRMPTAYQRIIDSDGNVLKYFDPEICRKGLGTGEQNENNKRID